VRFKTLALLPLAACTLWATAADANFFTNHRMNVHRFVGSAPSPTPEQVRNNAMPMLSAAGGTFTVRQAGLEAAKLRTAQLQ
jgi:hypothetical protein